jgi:hypothetical protein
VDFVTSALIASWIAIALLAFVVAGLVRQVHHLSKPGAGAAAGPPAQRAGIEPGRRAPAMRAVYAERSVTAADSAVPVLTGRVDLFEAYDALATPYAVLVDATGRVARSEPLGSTSALLELLDSALPGPVRSS